MKRAQVQIRVIRLPHDVEATTSGVSENQNVPLEATCRRSLRNRIAEYSPFRAASFRPTPTTAYTGTASTIASIWKSSASCRPTTSASWLRTTSNIKSRRAAQLFSPSFAVPYRMLKVMTDNGARSDGCTVATNVAYDNARAANTMTVSRWMVFTTPGVYGTRSDRNSSRIDHNALTTPRTRGL